MSLIPDDDLTQRLLAKILADMFKDEMMKKLRLAAKSTDQQQLRKKTSSLENNKRQQNVNQDKSKEESSEPVNTD